MMTLAAALLAEHLLFRPPLSAADARRLIRIDLIYGLSALIVLITGILRVLSFGKGADFYLGNPVFHAKFGVFLAVALLSVYPTVRFFSWRRSLGAAEGPAISPGQARRLRLILRIELLLLAFLPLLGVLVARGYGL
jgi:putative membrane protein